MRILLVLAGAWCAFSRADHFELFSELHDERYFLDDSKPVPVACEDGDCTPLFRAVHFGAPQHKIGKRAAVQIDSMRDYIKFLLRGNKTKDDDRNTEPYRTGNITLGALSTILPNSVPISVVTIQFAIGVVIDGNFVGDREAIVSLFNLNVLTQYSELDYLRTHNFSVRFFSPNDRPIPSTLNSTQIDSPYLI